MIATATIEMTEELEVSPDESRLEDRAIDSALADLEDDFARTGAPCSDDDISRAAERHDLSIAELVEVKQRADERGLLEVVGPSDWTISPELANREIDSAADTTDGLDVLFRQLRQFPLLQAADEIALGRAIEDGARAEALLYEHPDHPSATALRRSAEAGLRAKQRMVASNIRLAAANAREFRGQGLDFADLLQAAIPGLIRAAEKFDHRRGFKFSTYATWWIRQSIARYLADNGRMIRLPVHVVEQLNRFRRTRARLAARLGRDPTTEEVADALGRDPAEITGLIESIPTVISLDAPLSTDGATAVLADTIVSDAPSPFDEVVRHVRLDILRDLLDRLSLRERVVIDLRYGLGEHRPHTLEEVGEELGVTRERVRQIEQRAIEKMQVNSTDVDMPE